MTVAKKNSIIFVNQSSGYLMVDTIHAHLDSYDDVWLLTGYFNPRNRPLDEKVNLKMLLPYNRASTLKRLLSWLGFTIQAFFFILFKPNAKLYLVSNPPFVVLLAYLLPNRLSFLIYDVYPDALVQYGYLKEESTIVNFWKKINTKVFERANTVYTISKGMSKLIQKYTAGNKIKVVPVWSDNTFLKPIPVEENNFLKQHGLENYFVILYSGNLGRTHPIEALLDIAQQLRDLDAKIVIIGEGEKKQQLERIKKEKALDNVLILPFQPTETLPKSLASASIGVVTLGSEASNLSVPSKTYNLMSVGAPILAIAESDSELSNLLDEHENGACFSSDQLMGITLFIKSLYNNPGILQRYSKNSLKASLNYTPENAQYLVD